MTVFRDMTFLAAGPQVNAVVRLQLQMDDQRVVSHVINLLGGHDAAFTHFDADLRLLKERWDQDTGTVGRILRAHLFVEHFLTEYLVARNLELGSP